MFNAKPRPVLASKHGLWNINIVKRSSVSLSVIPTNQLVYLSTVLLIHRASSLFHCNSKSIQISDCRQLYQHERN